VIAGRAEHQDADQFYIVQHVIVILHSILRDVRSMMTATMFRIRDVALADAAVHNYFNSVLTGFCLVLIFP